ncbi:MAG: class I SAM-dependent methyltransferase, partial [Acidimicrobiales bacterium]
FAGDTPRYHTLAWRRAIESDARITLESEMAVPHPWPTDTEGVVDRALSTSFIAALGPTDQEGVAARVRAIVADLGPRFDYPYRSELQIWRRV